MKKSFLWRKVGRSEQEAIKRQAEKIMDEFGKALSNVGEKDYRGIKRKEQTREEGIVKKTNDFRKRMFDNAPRKEGDYIEAEKGGWK